MKRRMSNNDSQTTSLVKRKSGVWFMLWHARYLVFGNFGIRSNAEPNRECKTRSCDPNLLDNKQNKDLIMNIISMHRFCLPIFL